MACVRRNRSYNDIPMSGSGELESRTRRMIFVLGFVQARVGTLDFIHDLHDHKGCLHVSVCPLLHRHEYEESIQAAWNAVGEEELDIDSVSACDRCLLKVETQAG